MKYYTLLEVTIGLRNAASYLLKVSVSLIARHKLSCLCNLQCSNSKENQSRTDSPGLELTLSHLIHGTPEVLNELGIQPQRYFDDG